MLTKSQKIMVADGFPAALLISQRQRAAWWTDHPDLGIVDTHSFKDSKEDNNREIREQLKQEATALRIRKLLAGQARKTIAIKPRDIRGKRWDSRNNKWIPIDPQELNMKHDTEKQSDDQAVAAEIASELTANEENPVTKTPRARKPAKAKANKAAKKVVAKKAAKAKKPAKAKAKGNGNGKRKSNGKAHGAQTETVLAALKKGTTRAELLAKLGWNAINIYQFVPKSKLVVAKVEGERGLTYRLRK